MFCTHPHMFFMFCTHPHMFFIKLCFIFKILSILHIIVHSLLCLTLLAFHSSHTGRPEFKGGWVVGAKFAYSSHCSHSQLSLLLLVFAKPVGLQPHNGLRIFSLVSVYCSGVAATGTSTRVCTAPFSATCSSIGLIKPSTWSLSLKDSALTMRMRSLQNLRKPSGKGRGRGEKKSAYASAAKTLVPQ